MRGCLLPPTQVAEASSLPLGWLSGLREPWRAGAADSPAPAAAGRTMGLSERERAGCRALLELLETEELTSLTDTITNRLVLPQSRQEAIHAILVYSQSVEELLKRRKVYREIIFKYLAKEGVVVPPCSEKHQLIHHAKQYWSGQLTDRVAEREDINPNKQTAASPGCFKEITLQSYEQRQKQQEENDWHRLGREFCQWFFELLNSQHPLGRQSKEQWGPQHFWEDVKLKFCYNTLEKNMEEYVGAELVSLRLLSLVKEEYLLLNPNLGAGGLKCVISPHGLVVVAVAGTVHRGNICLGIFEQIFGLIRCPVRENTWKIKLVNLKIVGENALEPGTQVQKPSIKYESNELRELYDGKELSLLEPQILSNVRTELGE
ncbi:uncharacterized protein C3orf38 homolog isoform X2 [Lepidochelys kempii]|uniref:uncharacterized protein C3orf38 homolog isoform X2 n=1 Tax=Lepidochelys kempii TaxID=8472 RepID=UPI003C704E8D